jgi:hypothetical protein
MAISRMQQPRQLYGLGSLVKSIGKTVKKVVKSDLGKAALIGAAAFGIPGTQFGGLLGRGAGMFGSAPSIFGKTGGISALLGQKAMTTAPFAKATGLQKFLGAIPGGGYTVGAIGSILAASGMSPEEIEETKRDPEKVKIYLRDYYSKTNPDASAEEVEEFVTTNTSEYAVGGRVGLEAGANKDFQEYLKGREEFNKKQNAEQLYKEYLENKRRQKVAVEKTMAANGGLMPTGVMRANKAGTIERDYRETGGFVPVGIKEKADDVPAMLSKNEFVMTADAVRGMGGGNIEKGAQRLYDQMKTMEKRVV